MFRAIVHRIPSDFDEKRARYFISKLSNFSFRTTEIFSLFSFSFFKFTQKVVLIAKFKQNDVPLIVYNFIVDGRGGKIIFRNNKPNLNLALKGSNVQKKEK